MTGTATWQQQKATGERGQFGELPLSGNADVTLDEPVGADEFDWARIESLMGEDLYLAPDRAVAVPRIHSDDTVHQMSRKWVRYVAKVQDLTELTDEDIAGIAGITLDADGVEPAWLRSAFKVGPDDRIVVGVGEDGRPVYLSCRSGFSRSGCFRRTGTGTFEVENLAQKMVMAKFAEEFSEQHPEFTDAQVRQLFWRLSDQRLSGKRWAHLWDEKQLSDDVVAGVAAGLMSGGQHERVAACDGASGVADMVGQMSAEEITAALSHLETKRGLMVSGGVVSEPEVYVVPFRPGGSAGRLLYPEAVKAEVAGTSSRAKQAALNRAYREFLEEKFQVEYDFQMNRKYVRDHAEGHSATVFEDKKHIPQSHQDAAIDGVFGRSGDFRHVEIDADVELPRLDAIGSEYVRMRRYLPQTESAPALRFRKTGRHRAAGIYHPHVDNIAVDPRHPDSFVHEFIHHVDHTVAGRNLSAADDFRPILRSAQRAVLADGSLMAHETEYLNTPTEVLSRSAEMYFHWKEPKTSLNGDGTRYATDVGYTTLAPLKDHIVAFWDAKLAELGADVPGR